MESFEMGVGVWMGLNMDPKKKRVEKWWIFSSFLEANLKYNLESDEFGKILHLSPKRSLPNKVPQF